jgi:hypothetical protein
MVKKTQTKEVEQKKWERIFEFPDSTIIWRYDSKKSLVNPSEVEIKYKTDKKGGQK